MADPCSTPVPTGCAPSGVADARVLKSFARRFNRATKEAQLTVPAHDTNNDEALYPDKCGTYTKCVLQASAGKVDIPAYNKFRTALNSGLFSNFELVPLGGKRTLNGPMGAYANTFLGADASQFGNAPAGHAVIPPAPALASKAYATELVELYWCSLLRDIPFNDFHSDSTVSDACHELSGMPDYAGPKHAGAVTPNLLFRGTFPGETIGPYISQFFVTPTRLGAQPISQRYITYLPGFDYMTDQVSWEAVQQGMDTGQRNIVDPTRRYLHNGRGLTAFTHVDELFQAYFTAYLVLQTIKAPFNPGNPYMNSKVQNGFGTFGPPDFAAVLAEVAKIALNAAWYQKWPVHLRHRPESGAGLIHLTSHGAVFDGKPHDIAYHSKAVKKSLDKYGTYLLSQPFPEGSPAHPAYPAGHGTVGGACITILKFFFHGESAFPNPQVPKDNGTGLEAWNYNHGYGDIGQLTINGELHKLAHNVTFGHGIHGGIHWRSDSDSAIRLGEAVAIEFLNDLACTYPEPFTVQFTKLDGSNATISNQ